MLQDDCGKCSHCLDKTKFGGPGKLKKRCKFVLAKKRVIKKKTKLANASTKVGSIKSLFAKKALGSSDIASSLTMPSTENARSLPILPAPKKQKSEKNERKSPPDVPQVPSDKNEQSAVAVQIETDGEFTRLKITYFWTENNSHFESWAS